ncbi:ChiQ/YbfN family lipoprotein [Erwinia sp. 9145]|uniref:ChiQ/YbfN family lipoprotein n=1 Tax=Erwinia sp. 9145 TaxID=1500895 RepID=UPI00054E6C3A|nr:ChiQ/YbfN family lipoprotein [Erwinia sp. 9145]
MKSMLALIAMLMLSACATKSAEQPQETIPGLDYQRCLDAEQMGGAENIEARCGKLQQETEHTSY